jgi:hypothetical protein
MGAPVEARQRGHDALQDLEHKGDKHGTYGAVVVGDTSTEHMLGNGNNVGLKAKEPEEGEDTKKNSTH